MFSNSVIQTWVKRAFACVLICVAVIVVLFPLTAQSDQTNTQKIKLLILGDSLSAAYGLTQQQGWVHILQDAWQTEKQPIEVVNAAISGDTTDGGLARLPRLLNLHKPSHLWIELGGNDALQGHNPQKIKNNIEQMIILAEQSDVSVILQEIQIPTNYGNRYREMFRQGFHQLASAHNLPIIPFFLQDIALQEGMMQNDGIHPNAKAQSQIVDFLKPRFEEILFKD